MSKKVCYIISLLRPVHTAQKSKTSCFLPESFRSKTFKNVSVASALQICKRCFSGESPGINAFHVIFAESVSTNRSTPVMAENTVATAALLCLLLYLRFKRRQKVSRRSELLRARGARSRAIMFEIRRQEMLR